MPFKFIREDKHHFVAHNGKAEVLIAKKGLSPSNRTRYAALCRGGKVQKLARGGKVDDSKLEQATEGFFPPTTGEKVASALLGPENPPVHAALQAVNYMTGPENPPVHMALQAIGRADPAGVMGMGMPVGMAASKLPKIARGAQTLKAAAKPMGPGHAVAVSESGDWIHVRGGHGGTSGPIFSAPLRGEVNARMGYTPDDVRRQAYEAALHARLRHVQDIERAAGRVGPLHFRDMEFPRPGDPDFIPRAQAALARGYPGQTSLPPKKKMAEGGAVEEQPVQELPPVPMLDTLGRPMGAERPANTSYPGNVQPARPDQPGEVDWELAADRAPVLVANAAKKALLDPLAGAVQGLAGMGQTNLWDRPVATIRAATRGTSVPEEMKAVGDAWGRPGNTPAVHDDAKTVGEEQGERYAQTAEHLFNLGVGLGGGQPGKLGAGVFGALKNETPGFYSNAERTIAALPRRVGEAWKWLDPIVKSGVKKEELEASGLPAWLEAQGGREVTRDEIVQFIQQNQVRPVTTVLGEGLGDQPIPEKHQRVASAYERHLSDLGFPVARDAEGNIHIENTLRFPGMENVTPHVTSVLDQLVKIESGLSHETMLVGGMPVVNSFAAPMETRARMEAARLVEGASGNAAKAMEQAESWVRDLERRKNQQSVLDLMGRKYYEAAEPLIGATEARLSRERIIKGEGVDPQINALPEYVRKWALALAKEADSLDVRTVDPTVLAIAKETVRILPEVAKAGVERFKIEEPIPPQYPKWTLPGFTPDSYQEMLIHAERGGKRIGADRSWESHNWARSNMEGKGRGLLGHIRTAEHTLEGGKKIHMVMESQADLHQEGASGGYFKPHTTEEAAAVTAKKVVAKEALEDARRAFRLAYDEEWPGASAQQIEYAINHLEGGQAPAFPEGTKTLRAAKELQARFGEADNLQWAERDRQALPPGDMPWKGTAWEKLLAKRAIQDAVEKGYDTIAWPTGDHHVGMYGLEGKVSRITYEKGPTGKYRITMQKANGETMKAPLDGSTPIREGALATYVGGNNAKTLIGRAQKDSWGILKEGDLNWGAKGMREYYDRRKVAHMAELVKPFGGKVVKGTTGSRFTQKELLDAANYIADKVAPFYEGRRPDPAILISRATKMDPGFVGTVSTIGGTALHLFNNLIENAETKRYPIWYVEIPAKLREQVITQGQKSFAHGGVVGGKMHYISEDEQTVQVAHPSGQNLTFAKRAISSGLLEQLRGLPRLQVEEEESDDDIPQNAQGLAQGGPVQRMQEGGAIQSVPGPLYTAGVPELNPELLPPPTVEEIRSAQRRLYGTPDPVDEVAPQIPLGQPPSPVRFPGPNLQPLGSWSEGRVNELTNPFGAFPTVQGPGYMPEDMMRPPQLDRMRGQESKPTALDMLATGQPPIPSAKPPPEEPGYIDHMTGWTPTPVPMSEADKMGTHNANAWQSNRDLMAYHYGEAAAEAAYPMASKPSAPVPGYNAPATPSVPLGTQAPDDPLGAGQQGPQLPELPQVPDLMGGAASTKQYDDATKAAKAALDESAKASQRAVEMMQQNQVQQMNALSNHMNETQDYIATRQAGAGAMQQELLNAKINPRHFFELKDESGKGTGKEDTLLKIRVGLGMLLSGIGSGLTGAPNLALQVIDKAIERDIDAQKANINKGLNLYAYYLQQTRDDLTARSLVKADLLSVVAAEARAKELEGKALMVGPEKQLQSALFDQRSAAERMNVLNAEAQRAKLQYDLQLADFNRKILNGVLGWRQGERTANEGPTKSQTIDFASRAGVPGFEPDKIAREPVLVPRMDYARDPKTGEPLVDPRTGKRKVVQVYEKDEFGNPVPAFRREQRAYIYDHPTVASKNQDEFSKTAPLIETTHKIEAILRAHPAGMIADLAFQERAALDAHVAFIKSAFESDVANVRRQPNAQVNALLDEVTKKPGGFFSSQTGSALQAFKTIREILEAHVQALRSQARH